MTTVSSLSDLYTAGVSFTLETKEKEFPPVSDKLEAEKPPPDDDQHMHESAKIDDDVVHKSEGDNLEIAGEPKHTIVPENAAGESEQKMMDVSERDDPAQPVVEKAEPEEMEESDVEVLSVHDSE